MLATRQLSCFCQFCIAGQYDQCTSSTHVDEWQIVKLKYKGPASLLPSFTSGTRTDKQADVSIPCSDDVPQQQMELDCSGDNSEMQVSGSNHNGSQPNPTNLEHDGSEPDPTNLSADEDRISFFQSVTGALTACRNFAEIEEIARGSKEAVEGFRVPFPCVSKPVSSHLDCYAASLLQPEVQDRVFAICVAGDGNCFFRSLSLLVLGTQNHHQELRCRIIMAMAINTTLFLDGTNWCSSHDQVTPESGIEVALMTSVLPTASSPKLALEAEVMSALQETHTQGFGSFLQLHMCSSVLCNLFFQL